MVEQHYCLRWNNYCNNITAEFETLREAEHFVDVTLACDGRQLKAHKVVLSACSPYFKELLQGNPCSHPIIILRDVSYNHMRSLLEFMYQGEVNISQSDLGSFLQTAEALKIRGLAEKFDDRSENNDSSNLSTLRTSLNSLRGRSMNPGSQLHERPTGSESHSSQSVLGPSHGLLGLAYPPPTPGSLGSPVERPAPDVPSPSSYQSIDRSKGSDPRETMSPLSLPPNKRLRGTDRRAVVSASKGSSSASSGSPHNGCSSTNSNSVLPDTAIQKVTPGQHEPGGNRDEYSETIPKVEPSDPPLSDTEGSSGWMEEDSGPGGGELSRSPGLTHGNQWPPSTPGNPPSEASENASHLLQALSSESHLQGIASSEGEPMVQADDGRCDPRELRDDPAHHTSSSPPLPPSSLPHSCQLCGKMISCRRNLWKHMERVHFTNPAVQCSLCSKMFKNKYALKDHQRIYHGGQSEPFQISGPPSHVAPPSSLLSRILQDSRQHHPMVEPNESATASGRITSRHSLFARRPEDHEATYSLAVPPMMTPPFQGPVPPPRSQAGPSQEWSPTDEHYPMVSRTLHAEAHHAVSKSE